MGGRIGVVIALTTLVSYLHMLRSMRAEVTSQLEVELPVLTPTGESEMPR